MDPKIGDKVRYENGFLAEVKAIGNIATINGVQALYNIVFLEGPLPGVNCLREEFTFPISD
jgi:hypothetical protein